jgi:hypothetical protein
LLNPNGTLWDFPFSLFSSGAQGAWYDPSDFSTLFQDSAGSTPVTAVEQPVRLMRDRSGRGNDATAPNDASRPVLRARYNLLTFSEQFDNAAWGKEFSTITANAGVAPDGTTTADKFVESASNNLHRITQNIAVGVSFLSVYAKAAERTKFEIVTAPTDFGFDLTSGTVLYGGSGASITDVGNGWFRCVVTYNTNTPPVGFGLLNASNNRTYLGDGTSGILLWGAQLLTAADQTSTGGAYQRIAAATDYDTSNPVFRPYLAFDGSDDCFNIASAISITTDMTVVRGFGRAATGIQSLGIANSVDLDQPYDESWYTDNVRYGGFASGVGVGMPATADTSTGSFVTTTRRNGSTSTRRSNGVQIYSGAIGAASGSLALLGRIDTLYNNGPIYGLIVLDRELTGSELTATEQWMAGKTGVTL